MALRVGVIGGFGVARRGKHSADLRVSLRRRVRASLGGLPGDVAPGRYSDAPM
jgi:hypothetical protein